MPCYRPLKAWRAKEGGVTFIRATAFVDLPLSLPCGQCIGCRLERSRQWAVRCVHEAQMHEENCFITLTFNPECLEKRDNPWSVDVRDWQLFIKRLRKRFGPGIRFFHCGEYGEYSGRPHYHACLFNFDFPDKQIWKVNNGQKLYVSKILEEIWPDGFCTVGSVTFESAAYVARYIMKKITGERAVRHYEHLDPVTGEITQLNPEYTTMSRRPGLGHGWLKKYESDVYPSDQIIINGKILKPPRYYDNQFEIICPDTVTAIKKTRIRRAKKQSKNNTVDRLAVREFIQNQKLKQLPRNYDKE